MTHVEDDELVLYYYAEGDGLPDIRAHLDLCPACAERLAALEQSLAAVSASTIPERDESYGQVVWARIQPQLGERDARTSRQWLSAHIITWPRLALAGGMAVLLVAAFFTGRNWQTSPPAPTHVAPGDAAITAEGQRRVLYGAVSEHLERSAMVLTELTNRRDAHSTDISGEQVFTGDLVAANRLYRQSASRQGEAGLADLLDQLERVLVEITNSPSRMPPAQLETLRQHIEDQGLIFKIRVLESQARQRQHDTARTPIKPAATKS